ncbi:MAG: DUF4176 domain-containing protein [Bacteroidales bacterium]|nr:DUF4176 domain-containing protein [Clostridium sp.]MCM1203536.1 DUF4176 domain-containing protein [Bacteroidales bacterium]
MIRDLLPIGTVVLLKEAKKPLMIFGIKQMAVENPDEEYDYIGVLYPEGNMGANYQYLFNHDDIQEIYFKGYETEERKKFLEEIAKAYDE